MTYNVFSGTLNPTHTVRPPIRLSTTGMKNEPCLPLTPSSRAATLWLVLISRTAEGRKLSWPGWLGEILRWLARPKTVTHPSI